VYAREQLIEPEEPPPFGSGLLKMLCLALSSPFPEFAAQFDEPASLRERRHYHDDPALAGRLGGRTSTLAVMEASSWGARRGRYDEILPCGLTRSQVRTLEAREITPEDHELLLVLDSASSKKTVLRTDQLSKALTVAAPSGHRHNCSICLETVEPWQRAAKLRACGHAFHRKCITKWLTDGRDTCPLCTKRAVD
jgi:hypothetical protein